MGRGGAALAPWDIAAIRFGVAGAILLPYLLKKGLAVDRLGWAGSAAIMVGGGAPVVLLSYCGLLFAPAAHAASLFTALIPLYVAIVAAVVLGEAFTIAKRIGLASIVIGVLGIVWGASSGSAFAALGPAITAILANPILGKWPAASDGSRVLISVGVYIASGPLPVRLGVPA